MSRRALARFVEPVLRESQLDPYHTAGAIRELPVLMLHARYDQIVPASAGELLYQRLGQPERWSFASGHLGLFMLLPFKAGRRGSVGRRSGRDGPGRRRGGRGLIFRDGPLQSRFFASGG